MQPRCRSGSLDLPSLRGEEGSPKLNTRAIARNTHGPLEYLLQYVYLRSYKRRRCGAYDENKKTRAVP